jgi:Ankyrin repeats (many copies)/Sulphur oxidation protein SoxZ/Ankyrin repeat
MCPRSLRCTVLTAFALMFTSISAADYPQKAFEAKTKNAALLALFGTDRVVPSDDVQILPSRVGFVPIRIALAKPQRVAILVTRHYRGYAPHGLINPADETPLVAVLDLTERIRPHIRVDIGLALPSRIDVVVLAQGKLHGASKEDKFDFRGKGDWESHGWDIPPCPKVLKPKALPRPISAEKRILVVSAETIYGGGITKLDVGFRHPMEPGWWFDWKTCEQKPKHLIQALQLGHGGKRIGGVWMGPGMGRRVSLMLDGPKPGDELFLDWRDTAGTAQKSPHTITLTDHMKNTALTYAALYDDTEWVRRTLEDGTDVDMRDGEGQTALHRAAVSGNTAVARLLLTHGADIEARAAHTADIEPRESYGNTTLTWAADAGQLEMVTLLLAHGAKPDARGKGYRMVSGNTPLIAAMRNYLGTKSPEVLARNAEVRTQIARLLVKAGVDVNAKASDGKSPLALARENGYTDAEKMLRKAGAKE